MKRTVSENRLPEYPTVSVDQDYFRKEISEAQDSLDDQGFDQAYRLQLNLAVPPIDHAENIIPEIESDVVYFIMDGSNGEYRRNEQVPLDYNLTVPEDIDDNLRSIESAIDDAGFEKEFWKIDGVYTPMERTYDEAVENILDYARSMQVRPNLLVDADLDSSITVGWFSKAPLSDDVQFGYRAFPNREFEEDTIQDEQCVGKILRRLTGEREDEINNHNLSPEETEKLLALEESMNKYDLL